MNSPVHFAAAREDFARAQQILHDTLVFARARPQVSADPLVISRFGDLKIRLDVAQALLEHAEGVPAGTEATLAGFEASIASAEALRAAGNWQRELTVEPGAQPLREQYRLLGDYWLNGVAPA